MASLKAVQLALRAQLLTLSVLPSAHAWELKDYIPASGTPYVTEAFIPATTEQISFPSKGASVWRAGMYVITWYGLASDSLDLADKLDAALALYAPGSVLAASDGTSVRIGNGLVGPTRSQIKPVDGGWAVSVIRIPWAFESITP